MMTHSIMTFSIVGLMVKNSILTLSISNDSRHAECHNFLIVMPNVVMLRVVKLRVVILIVVAPIFTKINKIGYITRQANLPGHEEH